MDISLNNLAHYCQLILAYNYLCLHDHLPYKQVLPVKLGSLINACLYMKCAIKLLGSLTNACLYMKCAIKRGKW